MNTIFSEFQGRLTKWKAKVTENNVSQLFSLEFRSIYDVQGFLADLNKVPHYEVMKYFDGQVFWDSMGFEIKCDIDLGFDHLEAFKCELVGIKIRKKYSSKDMANVYTYELLFQKEIDKEIDSIFVSFLNHTEEDENGSKHLMDFPISLEYIPPVQTDMFEKQE